MSAPAPEIQRYREDVWRDPVGWCDYALGAQMYRAQARIAEAVRDHPRVAVASSNAAGKSYVSALLAHWYIHCTAPGYVVLTGASWQGVEKILMPTFRRVRSNARLADIRLSKGMLETEWKLDDMWGVFGVSTKRPENFAGFRTENGVFAIVDEASALRGEIYDAIMGLTASSGSRVLMIGNPLQCSGPFWNAFKSTEWYTLSISAFDVPNVILGRDVIPGLATRQWVEERRREWGETSIPYQARVLGRFPERDSDAVVPLVYIQQAKERYETTKAEGPVRIGADIARYGDDKTVLTVVQGLKPLARVITAKESTMQAAGRIVELIRTYNPEVVSVDDIGVGGGVVDRLHEMGHDCVQGVNVAESPWDLRPHGTLRFYNLRAEAWWNVRRWFEDGGSLPPEWRSIEGDLTGPVMKPHSSGVLILEPKDKTKKRLGHSPDEGDSLMLALLPPKQAPFAFV